MKRTRLQLNRTIFAVFLTLCNFATVSATSLQSHKSISNAVKSFVMQQQVPLQNIQVNLTSLNNQLQIPRCNKALQVKMNPGTKLLGHTSLMVMCSSPQRWKIHVAAHIDGQVNALIARHPITRGSMIKNTDLDFVSRRYSQLNHGYYGSAKLLMNMEAKRNIKMGQILTPALVRAQKLVLRGQHVTIVAQTGGLNLRVKGKALMDGQHGQTIKVKNLNSKKLIFAKVISSGMVKVALQ